MRFDTADPLELPSRECIHLAFWMCSQGRHVGPFMSDLNWSIYSLPHCICFTGDFHQTKQRLFSLSQPPFIQRIQLLLQSFFIFFSVFEVSHSFYYWNVVFVQSVFCISFSSYVVLSAPLRMYVGGENEVSGFSLHFTLAFYIYECIFHHHCTMLILIFPLFPFLHFRSLAFFLFLIFLGSHHPLFYHSHISPL